jgi:hypothetical protein
MLRDSKEGSQIKKHEKRVLMFNNPSEKTPIKSKHSRHPSMLLQETTTNSYFFYTFFCISKLTFNVDTAFLKLSAQATLILEQKASYTCTFVNRKRRKIPFDLNVRIKRFRGKNEPIVCLQPQILIAEKLYSTAHSEVCQK